jgi:transposase InsO family protein
MHDADTKFTEQFDGIFKSEGIKVKKHLPASPNLNAFVERWIQSAQQECLDHFIVLGEQHLWHIVSENVDHYNNFRSHENRNHLPPAM